MWMFPGRIKEESFGNQKWAWLAFIFLNIGLWLRVFAEPLIYLSELRIWKVLLVISAVVQLIAVLCYVIEIWSRVKGKKKRIKKKAGSK